MHLREKDTDPTPCPSPTGAGSTLAEWLAIYHFSLITHHFSPLNGTKRQWDKETFFEEPSPCLAESLSTSVQPNQRSLCSAEPTVAGRRVKQFPNSAAVSISIYNAIKSAAVSRITNPDTPCGRITNAPELRGSLPHHNLPAAADIDALAGGFDHPSLQVVSLSAVGWGGGIYFIYGGAATYRKHELGIVQVIPCK